MTAIAFIGLGIMGSPMAVHLQNAGHQVAGYNKSPGKAATARRRRRAGRVVDRRRRQGRRGGGRHGPGLARCRGRPDGRRRRVRSGGARHACHRLLEHPARRDRAARRQRRQARASGSLDAPVSGGEAGAKNAALVDHGGRRGRRFRCGQADPRRGRQDRRPRRTQRRRPDGQGGQPADRRRNIQVLAEAVVFLEAYGVDTEAALEVLGGGLAGSKVLDQKKRTCSAATFDPGFRIDLHHKDMGIVTAAAREAGVVLPVGAIVAQLMASARACGDGRPGPLRAAARRRAAVRQRPPALTRTQHQLNGALRWHA